MCWGCFYYFCGGRGAFGHSGPAQSISVSALKAQTLKTPIVLSTLYPALINLLANITLPTNFCQKSGLFNPLSPGVLDPRNYPGGSSGPTAIFWHFGALFCPLVTILNPIKNKGVITDHEEKNFQQILKTH